MPCGRFAPSPTGPLHFGSLLAAVGSYLQARRRGGRWLLRIEDIDPPREVPGAAQAQIETLARFGLRSDLPVVHQSQRFAAYRRVSEALLSVDKAFWCGCSRADLPASGVYPGRCRDGMAPGKQARSLRLRVDDRVISFDDALQGRYQQNLAQACGDFVIWRADGLPAYQLAVVVDDAAAGVTEVVRGSDLIDSAPRQIHLYQCLGLDPPSYLHLPLVVDEHGRKLSKSDADDPVESRPPGTALRLVLRALGHEPPTGARSLDALFSWALRNWQVRRIPRGPVCIGVHPTGG